MHIKTAVGKCAAFYLQPHTQPPEGLHKYTNHSHNHHKFFSLIQEFLGRMKQEKDGGYVSI